MKVIGGVAMTRINRSIRKRSLVGCFVSEICIPSFPRTQERIPSFPRKRESSVSVSTSHLVKSALGSRFRGNDRVNGLSPVAPLGGLAMARMPFKSALGSRFRGNDVGGRWDVTLLGAFLAGLLLATFLTVS